jgi:hypothetical protein
MKQLVEFKLEDGSTIVVETDEPEIPGGPIRAGKKPGEVLEEARHKFADALDKIQVATEQAIVKLRNLSQQPDEVTMEFGFNLSAQFGAIIASASTEANYKVTLRWAGKEASK